MLSSVGSYSTDRDGEGLLRAPFSLKGSGMDGGSGPAFGAFRVGRWMNNCVGSEPFSERAILNRIKD